MPRKRASAGSDVERLQKRKVDLSARAHRIQRIYHTSLGLSVFIVIAVPIFVWRFGIHNAWALSLLTYFAVPLAFVPITRGILTTLERELQAVDFEIDLLQFGVNPREMRAEKILRLNDLYLQTYYRLNIGQNIWVFVLGIVCILLGLTVIGTTMYIVISIAPDLDTKMISAVIGSIGGLLSSYVAAIYLKMHAAASSHLGSFHTRLVETQQLLLGNLLASRIEDDNKRWETLSQLALNMAKKGE